MRWYPQMRWDDTRWDRGWYPYLLFILWCCACVLPVYVPPCAIKSHNLYSVFLVIWHRTYCTTLKNEDEWVNQNSHNMYSIQITDHQGRIRRVFAVLLQTKSFRLCQVLSCRIWRTRIATGTKRWLVLPTIGRSIQDLRTWSLRLLLQRTLSQTVCVLLCVRRRMQRSRSISFCC